MLLKTRVCSGDAEWRQKGYLEGWT
jgi:hypothetical protein